MTVFDPENAVDDVGPVVTAVLRPDGGGKSKYAVVAQPDHFVWGDDGHQHGDRARDLRLHESRTRRGVYPEPPSSI